MGIYLSHPNKNKSTELGSNALIEFGLSSMQGWRMSMEDSHISEPQFTLETSLFAVFDGHGGSEIAKFCSDNFGKSLKKNKNFITKKYEKALEETCFEMDKILFSKKGQNMLKKYRQEEDLLNQHAGCTAIILLLTKEKYYIANLGDSKAILFTKEEEIENLSFEHKPENKNEKKRIEKAGGYVLYGRVNGNINLSRALGDLSYKVNKKLSQNEQIVIAKPDIEVRDIKRIEDFIVIGCDGIWETLTENEICEFIKKNILEDIKIEIIVEKLLDKLIAKDTVNGVGCDNMTCIVIKFK